MTTYIIKPINYHEFNKELLTFKPKMKGTKIIRTNMLYNGSKFFIETPYCYANGFGKDSGITSYSESLKLKEGSDIDYTKIKDWTFNLKIASNKYEEDEKIIELFINILQGFEEKIVEYAENNCKKLFKKAKKKEVVSAFFSSILTRSENENTGEEYAPSFNIGIGGRFVEKKLTTTHPQAVFLNARTKKQLDENMTFVELRKIIVAGTNVRNIISPSFWTVNDKFGVKFYTQCCKYFSTERIKFTGNMFSDSNEETKEHVSDTESVHDSGDETDSVHDSGDESETEVEGDNVSEHEDDTKEEEEEDVQATDSDDN